MTLFPNLRNEVRAKRVLDLALSIIAILPATAIGLVIALLVKLEDGGPAIFRQERIGKDCRPYEIYKFRSMSVGSPVILTADGSTLEGKSDPRVTRIGRLIRRTSLDELPQIINVLQGEMSWVGPRPSLIGALKTYEKNELPKFEALPGITGYTQAYYRNSISNKDKRSLDAWYARNRTLTLDLRILLKTVQTVLRRDNQLAVPHD